MEEFAQIIAFGLLVLNIILFIKIWEMTDNVKAIRNILSSVDFDKQNIQLDEHEEYGNVNVGDNVVHKNLKGKMTIEKFVNDNEALCKFSAL